MEKRIQEHAARRSRAQQARGDYSIELVEGQANTYRVEKADGTAYVVDLDAETCTCPDFRRRLARRQELSGVWCKHLHLCAASFLRFAAGRR